MAEKISKLAIKVDLSCRCCYKKIQRVLCKLQARGEKIQTITFDEKNNTVTIAGPFDPHKLSKKLWCKACKVIKSIEIIPDPPPKPTPPKPPPPKVKPCKVINDVQIVVCDHHKDGKCVQIPCKKEPCKKEPCKKDDKDKKEGTSKKECCKVINDIEIIVVDKKKPEKKPEPPKKDKPEEKPKPCPKPPEPCHPPCPKPQPCHPPICPKPPEPCHPPCPKPPQPCYLPICPKPPEPCYPPVVPFCCYQPCHVGHQGGSRCCTCGTVYGCVAGGPSPHHGGSGGHFFWEEEPPKSCPIM